MRCSAMRGSETTGEPRANTASPRVRFRGPYTGRPVSLGNHMARLARHHHGGELALFWVGLVTALLGACGQRPLPLRGDAGQGGAAALDVRDAPPEAADARDAPDVADHRDAPDAG